MSHLTEKSDKIFKGLCNKKLITEKELKYFSFSFKNACCLGKMYLLSKIHKRLFDVSGCPVIPNCGIHTGKVSGFLDYHLQPVMKGGRSYVKDTQDFLEKLKHLGKMPPNAILVTADVVGLYPSIPEFVLKNNYFEFHAKVKKQISQTVIGTKFGPPYKCIFMDKVER